MNRKYRAFGKFIILYISLTLILGPFAAPALANPPRLSKNNVATTEEPPAGGMIGDIVNGLIDGATGEIGGDAIGMLLSLLGWGNGPDYTDDFDRMFGTLSEIKLMIQGVENDLKLLSRQLSISTDTVLANINNPTNAINRIASLHDDLENMTQDKKPGEGDKKDITHFAKIINDPLHTRLDVDQIHDAIHPLTQPPKPVLNNFMELCTYKKPDVFSVYLALEKYTSQLLMYQLEGVNLIVEAENVLSPPDPNDPSNSNASIYMENYKKKLTDELSDPSNGVSFTYNVWNLILNNVKLENPDTDMLPEEASQILARAEFFTRSAISGFSSKKNFGGTVLVFSTKNTKTPPAIGIKGKKSKPVKVYSIPGKTYDLWDNENISPENLYDVYVYEFESLPPGNYKVYDLKSGKTLGTLEVKTYNKDFEVKSNGAYTFGLLALGRRKPNHFEEKSGKWHVYKKSAQNITFIGKADKWPFGIHGTLDKNGYEYFGEVYLNGHFRYKGEYERKITIHYYLDYSGYNEAYSNAQYGSAESCSSIRVSIWDATTSKTLPYEPKNKKYCTNPYKEYSSVGNGRQDFGSSIDHSCTFHAKPGHLYYLVIRLHTWCKKTNDATQKSTIKVDKVGYVKLIFPSSK